MPAEHHKPKAAFLCEGGSIFNVYDPETLALLEEKLSLSRTVFRKADLEKQPLLLADAEYIFSTWGMPAFTEAEIEKFFPRLQALFYGAGSVRGSSCGRESGCSVLGAQTRFPLPNSPYLRSFWQGRASSRDCASWSGRAAPPACSISEAFPEITGRRWESSEPA